MAAVVASTEVDRPADEVFAYATDPSRFAEWQQGVVDGHGEPSGTPPVGARCRTVRRIGGAERPATSEVTHLDRRAAGASGVSTARSARPWTSPSSP